MTIKTYELAVPLSRPRLQVRGRPEIDLHIDAAGRLVGQVFDGAVIDVVGERCLQVVVDRTDGLSITVVHDGVTFGPLVLEKEKP